MRGKVICELSSDKRRPKELHADIGSLNSSEFIDIWLAKKVFPVNNPEPDLSNIPEFH